MPAYIIGEITIDDRELYREYLRIGGRTVGQFGGKLLAITERIEALEGDKPTRVVLLEFENADAARRWYNSPDYQVAKAIRLRAAPESQLLLVTGGLEPAQ